MSLFRRRKPAPAPAASEQFTIKVQSNRSGSCYVAHVYDEAGVAVYYTFSASNDTAYVKTLTNRCKRWIEAETHRREIAAQGVIYEEVVGQPRRDAIQTQIARLEAELEIV